MFKSLIHLPSKSAFKKRRLWKGGIPSVNLCGREEDERVEKRVSSYLRRKDIDSGETATASNALEPLLDDVSMFEDTPSDLTTNYRVDDLLERISLLEKKRFLYGNLTDTDVKNYTGIEHSIFKVIVQTLEDFAPLNYWSGKPVKSISPEDQLLIFLMRLRLDLPYYDIAKRYSTSQTTIQNIIMTYLHSLHEIPLQQRNKCTMPESFGDFTNCRVIIDCTEFTIAAPRKDLSAASATYSNYKHYLSVKYLIGVAPN